MSLQGKRCVVTGASRGVGRGIALALGAQGATVIVCARDEAALHRTAQEICERGGVSHVMPCDMADDVAIARLAGQIQQTVPSVDVLVNCASLIPETLTAAGPFWSKPLELADQLQVGLRSSYVMTHQLAPALLATQGALVVNISSPGARAYMHGPAYGACKAGMDKLGHDMAIDFKPFGVSVITLWPGVVATERTVAAAQADPDTYGHLLALAESVEFNGRVIGALLTDSNRIEKTGQVFFSAELAQMYGVTDVSGQSPQSHRGWFGEPTQFSSAVIQ